MDLVRRDRADGKLEISLHPSKSGEANPPLRELLLDSPVDRLTGDRMAVAACLAFGRYFRGSIGLKTGVSARLAGELTAFRAPTWVGVFPVADIAAGYSGTGTTFVLDLEHRGWTGRNSIDTSRVVTLDVARSDRSAGRLFTTDRLIVSSNAWLLEDDVTDVRRLSPLLAVALLMGSDLDVSRLVVPHALEPNPDWERRVVRLLSSVGMQVSFCTMDRAQDLVDAPMAGHHGW